MPSDRNNTFPPLLRRAIAARWGWAHPGGFGVVYKSIYGPSPSSTLRG